MKSLAECFKDLGFISDIPRYREGEKHYFYRVFVKDLTENTSLIVEGYRKMGYSTYRFSFYKATYVDKGRKINEKVYLENASPFQVLQRVRSFINYIERGS
ncbi:hypothetical protein WV34_03555 [Bacillus amyloliquefaciens]|uniref:hypothetical protein n=1 Tax=Bacillaceae TaxID=186817 RepID=UPI000B516E3A|nr:MULTISPECIES: hypothetical protein [Bacillus amyloliquefaciens group]ASF27899.1 hypothetical protein WV34_03555 [Bacillus amyloliquefaciens]